MFKFLRKLFMDDKEKTAAPEVQEMTPEQKAQFEKEKARQD